ncbi:MAG: hypothetical protein OXH22_02675 [Chloroflexi bacterium]|nr:hypothetical protein [Chloroflexota bacterium]
MSIRQRSISSRELLPHIEGLYALMYLPVLIAGTAFMVWYELTRKAAANGHAAADSVYAIIIDVGYVAVADAGVTFGVVEGGAAVMVLARRWLERQEQKGFEQGLEQGREQGIERGESRRQREWEGWNDRRLQAQEEGRDFNEPPPRLDDENGDDS